MEGKKHTALDEGHAKFIEKLGLYYESYGIPRIGGRIIGLLLSSGRPVAAEEIAQVLKVSRSSVSTNVRLLTLYGFAEKAPGQGGRTDYYIIPEDAWKNAILARIEGFRDLMEIARQGMEAAGSASGKIRDMERWAEAMIEGHEYVLRKWIGGK